MMSSSTKGKAVLNMKPTFTRIKSLITAGALLAVSLFAGSSLTGSLIPTAAAAASSAETFVMEDQFTDRDLTQEPDLSDAVALTVADGTDLEITEAGVYVLSGTASEVTVLVDASSDAKVQLVLDGLTLTNADSPCIYVKSADKVFITTVSDSSLSVTGAFAADGSTNTDGVIFSKDDLTLNGTAVLTIASSDNGVVGKDDLKITGGTYNVTASSKAFEANDSIRVAGGTFNIKAGTDGFHAENDDDTSKGYVYIADGAITITCGDDAIHATTIIQIDGGTLNLTCAEGLEATFIRINDGVINISASDDGINAAYKSTYCEVAVEFNGGEVNIAMGAGDTDGVDSNGSIYMNGGVVSVTGNSTFDYDGTAQYTGGTIYVNGQQTSSIPNQMMGGMGGGRGGWGMQNGQGGGWGTQNSQDGQGGPGGGRGGWGGGRGGW